MKTKIKQILAAILSLGILLCTLSSCGTNPEKAILGKWHNDDGDCMEILSDNTYHIDFSTSKGGYDIGMDSGEWEYLTDEEFFKFYANDYDGHIYEIEINEDENGKYIKYSYFGTFHKN